MQESVHMHMMDIYYACTMLKKKGHIYSSDLDKV